MAYKMRDVAQRAGVSVTTVSHVLNRTRFVAPETAQRVLKVVQELNYYTNAHARRLAKSRSDLFGLIISEIANPFFPGIIKGFQAAAWERGYDVLLCNTEYEPQQTCSAIRKMVESEVRGVAVMTSSLAGEVAEELTPHRVGVVYCNLGPAQELTSNIQITHAQGISQALDHVIKMGHHDVAIIGGPQKNRTALLIRNAIVKGLEKSGLHPAAVLESDYRLDGGASAVSSLLRLDTFPTAIFCGNDLIAMGAMSALEDVGIRVPEDVSVIGFDDIPFARLARPPLTTIRVPLEQLGKTAFEALERMVKSKRQQGGNYVLGTSLVIRKSTAPPRKHLLRPLLTAATGQRSSELGHSG